MLQAKCKYNREKTLIMGIGNLLMGDEGVGIQVISRLQKNKELADTEIMDGGTGEVQPLDFFLRYNIEKALIKAEKKFE